MINEMKIAIAICNSVVYVNVDSGTNPLQTSNILLLIDDFSQLKRYLYKQYRGNSFLLNFLEIQYLN